MVIDPDGRDESSQSESSEGGTDERRRRRKERILHTRISEELAEDIRRIADDLRVPVSNIVRNVLEETFSVVERVSGDVGEMLEDVVDEAEAARQRILWRQRRQHRRRQSEGGSRRAWREADTADPAPEVREPETQPEADATEDIMGWQPLVLHRAQLCVLCGASLERGEAAFVAVTGQGVGGKFACEACVQR